MDRFYMGFNVNAGVNVSEDEAFEYAKEHLDEMSDEEKADFIEWFFSGDWLLKNGEMDVYGRWHEKEGE